MVSVTQTQRRQRLFWTLIGIISCTFWGISGLCAKGLFNISPEVTPHVGFPGTDDYGRHYPDFGSGRHP